MLDPDQYRLDYDGARTEQAAINASATSGPIGAHDGLRRGIGLAVYVEKRNPIVGLTLAQLDGIFSRTRLRGGPAIDT